jgi:hypothetical protein
MEARATLHRSAVSKNMAAVVIAVLAAFLLGGTGGYLLKGLSLPVATSAGHIVAGQPGASGPGTAWNYSTRRSGTQTVEGPAEVSASFREPSSERSGPQS